MHELIKIQIREGQQTVNARDLHEFLGVSTRFNDWIKNRIDQFGFIENQDFVTLTENLVNGGKQTEYHLSLDMAKELSMVERNEKGKQARLYFIECERRAKQQSPELQIAHAVLLAHKIIEDQKHLIEHLTPKAAFFDAVTDSKDAVDIGVVAKVLNCGIGRNRLFDFLRNENILMSNNQPYQKYIDCGYFRVIESSYAKPDGSTHVSFKTVVYQKGVDFIRRRLMDYKDAA